MHPGLRASRFGLHLRRGNSLIGARRETYQVRQLDKKAWPTTAPTSRPLGHAVGTDEVHHFLLPAEGWGAVTDTKEARELVPDVRDALHAWRKEATGPVAAAEVKRLVGLAQRVEVLWQLALRRPQIAERQARRHIDVWGAEDLPATTGAVQREQIEAALADPEGPYQRLRRVMDAWAALWSWPVTSSVEPPSRADWLDALTALLGTVTRTEGTGGRGLFAPDPTWSALADLDPATRSAGFRRRLRSGPTDARACSCACGP